MHPLDFSELVVSTPVGRCGIKGDYGETPVPFGEFHLR